MCSSVRITDEDDLYRRFYVDHIDMDTGRINSGAFKKRGKPDPAASVDLARLSTPEITLERSRRDDLGVGVLSAKVPIDLELPVVHKPLPDLTLPRLCDVDPHCEILNISTKTHCRQLADNTTAVIFPRSKS
jgi:hypothetical protein